jgi:hypothetical protein
MTNLLSQPPFPLRTVSSVKTLCSKTETCCEHKLRVGRSVGIVCWRTKPRSFTLTWLTNITGLCFTKMKEKQSRMRLLVVQVKVLYQCK